MSAVDSKLDCCDFVVRCIRALDDRNYDAVASSFAATGVWDRAGEELLGPPAVLAALAKRPAGLKTQHVVFNMVVDPAPDGSVVVSYSLLAYAQVGTEPFHLHAVFKAIDRLVSEAEGWRFMHRSVSPAFSAQI